MIATPKVVEIKEFARDVERLCDFFLAKASEHNQKDGSKDLTIIQDLKEVAADIQFDRVQLEFEPLDGLYDYMNGVGIIPKREREIEASKEL